MNRVNYQLELDKIIHNMVAGGWTGENAPKLLLHSCCAPCSSYCIEYLSQYFNITVFYYNPNISQREEYRHRVSEQIRLIDTMETLHPVKYVIGDYEPERFFSAVKGMEECPEGGERCFVCYRLRLEETARFACQQREKGISYDYFTTTLTISPLKNSEKLNEIGRELADVYGIPYLPSDFKKRDGYKRSIELSREYNLYRQDYCGCAYSQRERLSKLQTCEGSDIMIQ